MQPFASCDLEAIRRQAQSFFDLEAIRRQAQTYDYIFDLALQLMQAGTDSLSLKSPNATAR